MATGTVKFFNGQRGFGFISQDGGGPDVFVHISAVERAGMRGLAEGQKLTFDIEADRKTGKSAWNFATEGRVDSSPVVAGKYVYVGSTDGSLYVLDVATGAKVQSLELGRSITASPAVADGCLIIGTSDGVLACLGGP